MNSSSDVYGFSLFLSSSLPPTLSNFLLLTLSLSLSPTNSLSLSPLLQVHPQPRSSSPSSLLIQHTTGLMHPHVHHQQQGQTQSYIQQGMTEEELTPISRRGPLSDAEKLRKVIRELVDTERTYVEVELQLHVSFSFFLSFSSLISFFVFLSLYFFSLQISSP